MNALFIVIIIVSIIVFIYILYRIIISTRISIKELGVYPFLFIMALVLFTYSKEKTDDSVNLFVHILESLTPSLKLLAIEFKIEMANGQLIDNNLFKIAYIILYLDSVLGFASITISIFKIRFYNLAKKIPFSLKKEVDIVFGDFEDITIYLDNLKKEDKKKTIVIVKKNTPELVDYCFKNKIIFKQSNKIDKEIAYYYKYHKTINYISFYKTDKDIYSFLNCATSFVNKIEENNDCVTSKEYQFIISASFEQKKFLKEYLGAHIKVRNEENNKNKMLLNGVIRPYDKYTLLAYQFASENNFAKYLGQYLNDNGTIKDVDVNLFMIGFGKINQALLPIIVTINQFVKESDNKLVPNPINIHIFEKEPSFENTSLSQGMFRYRKDKLDKNEYFDLPEDFHNIDMNFNMNVGNIDFFNELNKKIKNNNKQHNIFIVSLGTDFKNCEIAEKIYVDMKEEGYDDSQLTIFVRTQQSVTLGNNNSNCFHYFGENKKMFTRDNVVLDSFFINAKKRFANYKGTQDNCDVIKIAKEWAAIPTIEKDSNLSSVASIPFKLALMKINDYSSLNKNEYLNIYNKDNSIIYDNDGKIKYEYKDHFTNSLRDVICVVEHLRWNAFEITNGIIPMKKSDIKCEYINNKYKIIAKSNLNKTHSNITTIDGLFEFHEYALNLYLEKANIDKDDSEKIQKIKNEIDVIKWDYQLMDNLFK